MDEGSGKLAWKEWMSMRRVTSYLLKPGRNGPIILRVRKPSRTDCNRQNQARRKQLNEPDPSTFRHERHVAQGQMQSGLISFLFFITTFDLVCQAQ